MEGLIPMVYKSLKKNKTRRQYECLSSGTAATAYDVADFYIKDDLDINALTTKHYYSTTTPGPDNVSGRRGAHHRRCNSVNAVGHAMREADHASYNIQPKQQLIRFRSHRTLFSCVTGGTLHN